MLAHAEDLDILDNDHLAVPLVEDGVVDNVLDVLLVALGEEHEGLGVALGGGQEALPVRVLSDALEDGANRILDLLEARSGLLLALLEPGAGSLAFMEESAVCH